MPSSPLVDRMRRGSVGVPFWPASVFGLSRPVAPGPEDGLAAMVRWRKGRAGERVGFVVPEPVRAAPPRGMNRDPAFRRLSGNAGAGKVKGLSPTKRGLARVKRTSGRRGFAIGPGPTPRRGVRTRKETFRKTGEGIGRTVSTVFSRRPVSASGGGALS
jgi:hypothetical protein